MVNNNQSIVGYKANMSSTVVEGPTLPTLAVLKINELRARLEMHEIEGRDDSGNMIEEDEPVPVLVHEQGSLDKEDDRDKCHKNCSSMRTVLV
uniref:Reverse transcriptase domain-containing protein n=1 Tax=Loa loa TaxID=7209 RepID=A0A1I7VFC6_LOALO